MSKKYYAVKKGYKIGVFNNWDECKTLVNGFSGAEYKSFTREEDAYSYLGENKSVNQIDLDKNENRKQNRSVKQSSENKVEVRSLANVKTIGTYIEPNLIINEYDLIAFVDGSYNKDTKTFGSGIAVLNSDGTRVDYKIAGPDEYNQWNIVGELEATKHIVKLAFEQGVRKLCIYHDLINIAHWSSGYYKAKNEYTIEFVRTIEKYSTEMDITFIHVPAHSGYELNEHADKLAKESIEEYLRNV